MPEPLAEAATWAGESIAAPSAGEVMTTEVVEVGAGGSGGLLEEVPAAEPPVELPPLVVPPPLDDELLPPVLVPELELDVVPELLVPVAAPGAGLLAVDVPAPEALVFVDVSSDFV